jgi:sulfite reductase alpha subunit-like flavoprotein
LVVAFSRHSPQPDQQQLLALLLQQQQGGAEAVGCGGFGNGDTAAAAAGDRPAGSSKVYVTHKLREHGAMMWQLLAEQGAWVYVSGSAGKMPAAVVSALEDVAEQHGGLSHEAAAKYVRQLELTGRYHVEAWS